MKDPNEKGGGGKKGPNKKGEDKKKLMYEGSSDDSFNSEELEHYLIGSFNNAIVGNDGSVTAQNLRNEYSGDENSNFTGDLEDGVIPNKQLEVDNFFAGATIDGEFDSKVNNEGEEDEFIDLIHLQSGNVRFPTGLVAVCSDNRNQIYLSDHGFQERIYLLLPDGNGKRFIAFIDGMNPGTQINFTGDLNLRLNRNITVTLAEDVDYRRLTNDQAYYNQIVGEAIRQIQEYKMNMLSIKRDKPDRGNGKGNGKGDGKGGGAAGAVSGLNVLNTKTVEVK